MCKIANQPSLVENLKVWKGERFVLNLDDEHDMEIYVGWT